MRWTSGSVWAWAGSGGRHGWSATGGSCHGYLVSSIYARWLCRYLHTHTRYLHNTTDRDVMVKMCKSGRGSNLKLSKCCWMLIQLCAAERIWSLHPVLCARHRSPHLHYYSHLHYDLTRLCVTSWPGRLLQFGHRYCSEYTVFWEGANYANCLLEVPNPTSAYYFYSHNTKKGSFLKKCLNKLSPHRDVCPLPYILKHLCLWKP